MTRPFLAAATAVILLGAGLCRADEPRKTEKIAAPALSATIARIDAAKGEITLKYTDSQGKPQEKVFRLTRDARILDETGRVIKLDLFQSGDEALVIESAGTLRELRRNPLRRNRTLGDAVKTTIEMSETDAAQREELQKIYDMLRKLDSKKDGKIDAQAVKTEADSILQERVKEFFNRLDRNHDGKISKDEAHGLIKRDFDQIDRNKDGFIDQDELLKAARERHEAKTGNTRTGQEKARD